MSLQFEKKIYERLGHLDKNIETLAMAHYRVMSMLIPEVRPSKEEINAFKDKGKPIPLKEVMKKLRYKKAS